MRRSPIGQAMERLSRLAADPAMRGIAGVFLLKASVIVLNFLLVMLAARVMDTVEFGVFSILFSAAGLFCIIATFGQQMLLMRSWNEYVAADDPARLKGALLYAMLACLLGCALIGAAFFLWTASTYTVLLALAVTLYMTAQAASLTSSHLVRTAIGVGSGDGYGNLLVVAPAILYLAERLVSGQPAEVSTIFLLFAAGGLAALAIHFALIRRRLGQLYPGMRALKPRFELADWRSRSLKLWISNALEATNQYLDVLIIGYLMSPAVAGGYFVTTRLANAFATASDTMHMFSTRHIPDLYYRGEFTALNRLMDSVAMLTAAFVAAGLVVLLAGGQFFLSIFNEAYVPYYSALALLVFGTGAIAAAGSCGSILMLTGHEGRYLSIIAATVAIRALGFFVLIPPLGILGAVSATTVSFLFMAFMLRQSAKSLAGLDGSVLRLLRRRKGAQASPAE